MEVTIHTYPRVLLLLRQWAFAEAHAATDDDLLIAAAQDNIPLLIKVLDRCFNDAQAEYTELEGNLEPSRMKFLSDTDSLIRQNEYLNKLEKLRQASDILAQFRAVKAQCELITAHLEQFPGWANYGAVDVLRKVKGLNAEAAGDL